MPLIDFTTPYTGGPTFFTGTGNTDLVPALFPVALNGRPYLLDLESNLFNHQFEPRVRDSSDNSTAPGESAINPQGFWRRGQKSWHLGAGQFYADDANAQDYRFYKSKGVNPWTKGQLTLLNATKVSLSSVATTQHMVVQDGRVYVSLDGDVKYTTDPFASSPTWTAVVDEAGGTAAPVGSVQAMATDGNKIFLAYPSDGIRQVITGTDPAIISNTKFVTGSDDFYMLGFAKNFMFGSHDHKLQVISASGGKSVVITPDDTGFKWVGVATGQNAVYAAGYSGRKSLIYKVTIKDDGTLDAGIVALELPTGEIATAISGYLGYIIIGTNKGVRYSTTDGNSNLIAGPIIPTTTNVLKFASNDRFSFFTWTNYDGTSGGLGRLDLSQFTATNVPAFATDLMYDSTGTVNSVVIFNDKAVFMVSGVGVIVEDSANLVTSGTLETGSWTWDIPDDKFAPKVDVRTAPLVGSVALATAYDRASYSNTSTFNTTNQTAYTYAASQTPFTEASYKLTLTRATATTGPTVTRWMARAWASPRRSEIITLPVILHSHLNIGGQDWWLDVETERGFLESLVQNPAIITYQERERLYSVIVEDVEFRPIDSFDRTFIWEGTAVITMRTVAE